MGLVRVVLALAVVLGHLPPAPFHFVGAGVAVQGFFIISGFYMALVLSGKYATAGLFYSNRLLRLMPAYFVMMAVAAFTLFVLNASATASPELMATAFGKQQTVAAFYLFENIAIVGQDLLYWFKLSPDGSLLFDPAGTPETDQLPASWRALLVPQSWSLSIELVFYALAPLLVRLRWQALVALAGASIALRFAGHLLPVDYGLWQGRLFPTALFLFVFGILAHRILPFAARAPKFFGWLLNGGLLALLIALPLVKMDPELARWAVYGGIAVATPFVFTAFKDISVDRWIGDLSYPIYLTHLVVVGLVLTYNPPAPAWYALIGTLLFSTVLLVWLDQPIDRWRQRRAERRALATGAPVPAPA